MLYLGTLTPTKEQWLSINIPVELTAITLTFTTFTGDSFDDVLSWIRLRRVWTYEAEKLPERSQKIYPSSDRLLLPLDPPVSTVFLDGSSSDIEVKKYYRFLRFPYTEPDWFITFHGIG